MKWLDVLDRDLLIESATSNIAIEWTSNFNIENGIYSAQPLESILLSGALSNGTYFCQLEIKGDRQTFNKMVSWEDSESISLSLSWQLVIATVEVTNERIIFSINDYDGGQIEIRNIQIESKPHSTSYIETERAGEFLHLPESIFQYSTGTMSFKWKSNIKNPQTQETWTLANIIDNWYVNDTWYNVEIIWGDSFFSVYIDGIFRGSSPIILPHNISEILLGSDRIKDIVVSPLSLDSKYNVNIENSIEYQVNGYKIAPPIEISNSSIVNSKIEWVGSGKVKYSKDNEPWTNISNGASIPDLEETQTLQFKYILNGSETISNIIFSTESLYVTYNYSLVEGILISNDRISSGQREWISQSISMNSQGTRESSNLRGYETFISNIDTDSQRIIFSHRADISSLGKIGFAAERIIRLNVSSLTSLRKVRSKRKWQKILTKKAEYIPLGKRPTTPKLIVDLPTQEVHTYTIKRKPPIDN